FIDEKQLEEQVTDKLRAYEEDEKVKKRDEKLISQEPDEQGWTTVTKSSRKGGALQTVKLVNKIKERNAPSTVGVDAMYSFQRLERKRKHIECLREKFEEDKATIALAKSQPCEDGSKCDESFEDIAALHKELDDDANGAVDLSESDDFLREAFQFKVGTSSLIQRQQAFHQDGDQYISVFDLWKSWTKSEVYNWTVEQTVDWLTAQVQLPQYAEIFRKEDINGRKIPKLASDQRYLIDKLGIKDPIHRQKINLKAMDTVLFGPPRAAILVSQTLPSALKTPGSPRNQAVFRLVVEPLCYPGPSCTQNIMAYLAMGNVIPVMLFFRFHLRLSDCPSSSPSPPKLRLLSPQASPLFTVVLVLRDATFLVMFAAVSENSSGWKETVLLCLLAIALLACYYAYDQNQKAQGQLSKMMGDLEGLSKAEERLESLQLELAEARAKKGDRQEVEKAIRKEIREKCALDEMADSSGLELEDQVIRLRTELSIVRSELERAEQELQDRCWVAPPVLQHWLQLTYEIELKYFNAKKMAAEKQLAQAREACERLRKKRTNLMGAFTTTHGKSMEDVDQVILSAKQALMEVTSDLQERMYRFVVGCGKRHVKDTTGEASTAVYLVNTTTGIVNNPGLTHLEMLLRGSGALSTAGSTGTSYSYAPSGTGFSRASDEDDDRISIYASSAVHRLVSSSICPFVAPSGGVLGSSGRPSPSLVSLRHSGPQIHPRKILRPRDSGSSLNSETGSCSYLLAQYHNGSRGPLLHESITVPSNLANGAIEVIQTGGDSHVNQRRLSNSKSVPSFDQTTSPDESSTVTPSPSAAALHLEEDPEAPPCAVAFECIEEDESQADTESEGRKRRSASVETAETASRKSDASVASNHSRRCFPDPPPPPPPPPPPHFLIPPPPPLPRSHKGPAPDPPKAEVSPETQARRKNMKKSFSHDVDAMVKSQQSHAPHKSNSESSLTSFKSGFLRRHKHHPPPAVTEEGSVNGSTHSSNSSAPPSPVNSGSPVLTKKKKNATILGIKLGKLGRRDERDKSK
ncbi:unnamed protein product, partial [Cyprideis torosa]